MTRDRSTWKKQRKHEKHGLSNTPEYRSWIGMHQRCSNKNHPAYPRYGGRGISVCKRWDSLTAFYEDMGPRPEGTSLDRINPYGNYEPGNCRWATREEQQQNKRESVSSMARKCGLRPGTVASRVLRYGWTIEEALITSLKKDDPNSITNRARAIGISRQALYNRLKKEQESRDRRGSDGGQA